MSSQRIELVLAGQKIAFAISPEHENSLRAAATLVNEQLEAALASNKNIERAAIMTAIKLAADLQAAKMNLSQSENPGASLEQINLIQTRVDEIEAVVDSALKTVPYLVRQGQ